MMQSFLWLVVAIFGLQSPALPHQNTVNEQASDNACAAASPALERSALITDREVRCGQDTAPRAEERATACESIAEEDERSYLVETASPSDTMRRQGPQTAIARLNPEFVARLASAISEARESGLPSAGIFSAYRPPAFGVGRFSDRFKSLHAYGLAVDMSGIGGPGSSEAKLWHEIAGRHGIFCPYGADNKREWNHCQATPIRVVCPDNPLRKTITADGPIELAEMFKAGNSVADDLPTAACVTVAGSRPEGSDAIRPHAARAAAVATSERAARKHLHEARNAAGEAVARVRQGEKARMLMVTADLRLGEKSHSKTPAAVKMREPRKGARGSEGHRDSTRHRSRLV